MYRSLLGSVGEGEGGMIWENGIETCILYVKQIASPGSMHDAGCSGLVHWDDPEGWDGEGSGRGFRMGNMCTPMADSCQCMAKPIQYCKVIRLQLKFFNVCFLTIKKKKKVVLGIAGGLPSVLCCTRLLRRLRRCQRVGVGLVTLGCSCSEHHFINEEIGAQSD